MSDFLALDAVTLDRRRTAHGFAMTLADLEHIQAYFRTIGRTPTWTELRVLDTYWSDHCRHTTFQTELTQIDFSGTPDQPLRKWLERAYALYREQRAELQDTKPESLMNMATIGARSLIARGLVPDYDYLKSECMQHSYSFR